jgi:hypothetical protein
MPRVINFPFLSPTYLCLAALTAVDRRTVRSMLSDETEQNICVAKISVRRPQLLLLVSNGC